VRRLALPLIAALAAGLCAAALAGAQTGGTEPPQAPLYTPVKWHKSRSVGLWYAGRLIRGVRLPPEGVDFFTWDPVRNKAPDRSWRRWGHERMILTLLVVLHDFRKAHPDAPRIGIGDISRRYGGVFGNEFGGLGHGSHQIGLDADVYYPRKDKRELRAKRVSQIDHTLAQDLVTRFVKNRAVFAFVGPNTGITGPRRIVQKLIFHDDHVHVRLRRKRGGR
jgi:murein endopeptidase